MINAYAVTVPGELDNVDFTREETRTIQGAIVQALAGKEKTL